MSRELMETTNDQNANEGRDTLFLLGGAALVVFGAGLILSTPMAREYLAGMKMGNLLAAIVPKDLQRYMRMRAM
jgi:hypothetical protein